MKPVLCFGDICADLIIPYGNALRVKAGEQIPTAALEVEASHGGSVGNTTAGVVKLGVPAMFCGTAGDDRYGHMLKDGLDALGVDTSLMRLSREIATLLVILVIDKTGDRVAFACPPRNASQHAILESQIPRDITERIGWMHSTGMTLREDPAASVQLKLMKRCRDEGIPVSLDVNARIEAIGDPFFYRNLIEAKQYCSVILGSANDEITLLAEEPDPEAAAQKLAANGTVVIARYGERGAAIYHDGVRDECPVFSVPVVDAVGAGDAYDACYIASRMLGDSEAVANRNACAAGAICVSRKSGRAGPTTAELAAFLKTRN